MSPAFGSVSYISSSGYASFTPNHLAGADHGKSICFSTSFHTGANSYSWEAHKHGVKAATCCSPLHATSWYLEMYRLWSHKVPPNPHDWYPFMDFTSMRFSNHHWCQWLLSPGIAQICCAWSQKVHSAVCPASTFEQISSLTYAAQIKTFILLIAAPWMYRIDHGAGQAIDPKELPSYIYTQLGEQREGGLGEWFDKVHIELLPLVLVGDQTKFQVCIHKLS